MSSFEFGDIVLLKFPFTGGSDIKKRPAMVVKDTGDGDFIVCRITSQVYNTVYDFRVIDWKNYGLKLPSTIRLHKIATLEKELAIQIIGKLDKNLKLDVKNIISNILS